MARFVGWDVSQKLTSICVVDDAGRRLWRGSVILSRSQLSGLCGAMRGMMRALELKLAR
jgi:hypothetical protein